MTSGLRFGPLGHEALHLCIDMQQLFDRGAPWAMPWMARVLPTVHEIASHHAARTVFTRFMPPRQPRDMPGAWQRYYERWANVTLAQLDPALLDLAPPLQALCPPARVLDKAVYSPWTEGHLDRMLAGSGINTLVITGGETDVCVLATVMGAVDRGFRVVLVEDAMCSSNDTTHDALLSLYRSRFGAQIETADAVSVLLNWDPPG
ncbi:cysteine hydrolase [Plastorhodobacter daqingensis]|uniref:Cysteine hydrolase n=1 Tax=Plastorhodobacter daqingensis TaxID=1387281 RepID=A0ABW2UNN4_9RHOB